MPGLVVSERLSAVCPIDLETVPFWASLSSGFGWFWITTPQRTFSCLIRSRFPDRFCSPVQQLRLFFPLSTHATRRTPREGAVSCSPGRQGLLRYRLRSIIYLHGYAVTKIKTTFAAQPPPLRVVSSEQVAHTGSSRTAAPPLRAGVICQKWRIPMKCRVKDKRCWFFRRSSRFEKWNYLPYPGTEQIQRGLEICILLSLLQTLFYGSEFWFQSQDLFNRSDRHLVSSLDTGQVFTELELHELIAHNWRVVSPPRCQSLSCQDHFINLNATISGSAFRSANAFSHDMPDGHQQSASNRHDGFGALHVVVQLLEFLFQNG